MIASIFFTDIKKSLSTGYATTANSSGKRFNPKHLQL
jgi:hypothetical protein